MVKIISSDKAPKAIGPYSAALLVGQTLFTSGQLGIDASKGALEEDVARQTKRALSNLGELLTAAQMDFSHCVKTTVFLADMGDFALVNEIYQSYFTPPYPARSCVQVAKLPRGALVEIEAVAVKF